MKKVFAVLFVAASIVLVSCGGAKTEATADSTATKDSAVTAPVAQDSTQTAPAADSSATKDSAKVK